MVPKTTEKRKVEMNRAYAFNITFCLISEVGKLNVEIKVST